MQMRKVFHIGPFPPPVHGMATVNQHVNQLLVDRGVDCEVFNLSPGTLKRGPGYLFARAKAFLSVWFRLLRRLRGSSASDAVLYLSLSGGAGAWLDYSMMRLSAYYSVPIIVHHHSFAYLDSRSALTGMLVRVGGSDTIHIVLYRSMEERLRELYGESLNVKVVSNLIFSPQVLQSGKEKTIQIPLRLGFIGNVSFPKGIVEFLQVVKGLAGNGLSVEASIAGPFENKAVKEFVENEIENHSSMKYFGPVYDEEKRNFFENLDVLLFPSKYKNEAAPLVILEALSYGIPVISTNRGCINEMLANTGSQVFAEENFVEGSIETIEGWVSKPEDYMERSRKAISRIDVMRESLKVERESFFSLFK